MNLSYQYRINMSKVINLIKKIYCFTTLIGLACLLSPNSTK